MALPNPLSLVTSVLALPGQLHSLRNSVQQLLIDKQHAQMWAPALEGIRSQVETLERGLKKWYTEWHLDAKDRAADQLPSAYWSSEGRTCMNNHIQRINTDIQTVYTLLKGLPEDDGGFKRSLKWENLKEVRQCLNEIEKLIEKLDAEAIANIRDTWRVKEGDETMERDIIQHKTYLVFLAQLCRENSPTLHELANRYRSPPYWATTVSCSQDLALDFAPGSGKRGRLAELKRITHRCKIVHHTRFTNLQFQAVYPAQGANLEPDFAGAPPSNSYSPVHWLRLPLLSVELSENSGQITNRRIQFGEALQDLADQTIQEAYIPVVQMGNPTRYFCFRNVQGHDHQRLEHKQKRTAVSLELPRARKVELALKITESALLWRHYGFEADVCSCRLQLIMMTKNDPAQKQTCFGFEFATIPMTDLCVKEWHKKLFLRDFHRIGVLLAELFLSENDASLKRLAEISDDEMSEGEEFNMLAKVAVDLEKVTWITPEAVEAVLQALRPSPASLFGDEEYYSKISRWFFPLFIKHGAEDSTRMKTKIEGPGAVQDSAPEAAQGCLGQLEHSFNSETLTTYAASASLPIHVAASYTYLNGFAQSLF